MTLAIAANSRRRTAIRDPLLAAYMADVQRFPVLSRAEERGLLAEVKTGNRKAVNALVTANLKFVVAVCWGYRNRGLPLPDLINEGNLGLFRAAEKFELANGLRFISYAVWFIRQGILTALARQPGSISIPPDRLYKALHFRRVENSLTQKLGHPPGSEEMEVALGETGKVTRSLGNLLECMASTRGPGGSGPANPQGISITNEEEGPEAVAGFLMIRNILARCLARLNGREKQIISLRYGLGHGVGLSLADVGSVLGLTRERVRQIEDKAIQRLRRFAGK
ncbi:MAG: RNA polymerase sigma factor RpoD/SigA [Fibrobacteria bacterium]